MYMCRKCKQLFCGNTINDSEPFLCNNCIQSILKSFSQRRVYRFISLDVFERIIKNQKLIFSLPSKWKDTFEEAFLKAIQISKEERSLDPIFIREMLASKGARYCMCWTKTRESERLWDEYGYHNTAVRIEVDLEDILSLNINCYEVKYSNFISPEKYLSFPKTDKRLKNQFFVNEEGEFEEDPFVKSDRQLYVDDLIGGLTDVWLDEESHDSFENVPLDMFLSTKQLNYSWENEVRFFVYLKQLDDKTLYKKHSQYVGKLYSNYSTHRIIDTEMPCDAEFSYNGNSIFKSVMCHPKMSTQNKEYVRKLMNNNGMKDTKIETSMFENSFD